MDQEARNNTQTIGITLYGVVQGIGFRPFIVKLAAQFAVTGQVANRGGFVALIVTGEQKVLEALILAIKTQAPPEATIIHMEVEERPWQWFEGFEIVASEQGESPWVMVPTDLPVCDACLEELHQSADRRYAHPLISCMRCGPRYSIIRDLPYDRVQTTMADFEMCEACKEEYGAREHRRYYAQTISCHHCGPYLRYRGSGQGEREQKQVALDAAVYALKKGGCVAIKGIGGYHLACSPFDGEAVSKLRVLKGRETKPFAVMFPDIEAVRQYCHVSAVEAQQLRSPARPIVLLKRRRVDAFDEGVCGFSHEVGAFLPYTAMQHMLLEEMGPLVMTSANRSQQPIMSDEAAVFAWQAYGLDGVLYHDRQIWVRLDDSVVRIVDGEKLQMIRRSRGYVPTPLYIDAHNVSIVGLGGQLKASFCLGAGRFAYPSEYFGDLADESVWAWYLERLEKLPQLLRFQSEVVVCDQHPQYRTTQYAKTMGMRVIAVQHHHAHIGSVMAEHQLERVIGVCFDGTGYGEDGTIWGGEFLVCVKGQMVRAGHLSTVVLLGGDESMKDAAKTACCYLAMLKRPHTDRRYETICKAIAQEMNTVTTSSMGRLFDAVASLLGYGDYNQFEGECAMRLEEAAWESKQLGEAPISLAFDITLTNGQWVMDAACLLQQLLEAKTQGENPRQLALGFHRAVCEATCEMVTRVSEANGIHDIALSGGVFQNKLLLESVLEELRSRGYHCYCNQQVPPNDGGIALGQVYIGAYQIKEESYVYRNMWSTHCQ